MSFDFVDKETNPELPGNYYVSVIDGNRWNLIYGPFKTHSEALENVQKARTKGIELDPKSHFYGWGTVKMKADYTKPGILNKYLD